MSIFSMSKYERYKIYEKHERLINWSCILLVFVISIFFLYNFVFIGMSESDFDICEKLVYDVYNQKEQKAVLYEVPKNFKLHVSDTEITARKTGIVMGCVNLYMRNNEIFVEKDYQVSGRIIVSILLSVVVVLFKFMWLANYNIKYRGPTKMIRLIK